MTAARRTVVFVLSSYRSGSTWTGYVLGSHGRSAFLGEFDRAWSAERSVPCTLCAARGLAECAVLHGAAEVPAKAAFTWAFERTGKTVLVDSSKSMEWTQRGIDAARDHDVRLVHILRDPRGWFVSTRRRRGGDVSTHLPAWLAENTAIRDFMAGAPCPATRVVYDLLAKDPEGGFGGLFDFCGLPFEPSALRYWEAEHHGFAANGASSPLLARANIDAPPAHFRTGDDDFYAANRQRRFVDTRWRSELAPADADAIAAHDGVVALLAEYGCRLTPEGVVSLPTALVRPSWFRRVVGRGG